MLGNPQSSRLFDFHPLQTLEAKWKENTAVVDQCCFGFRDPVFLKTFRKRTRFIGSLPLLKTLSCRCNQGHEHQHIEDSVTVNGKSMKRSKLASSYPVKLCNALSNLVVKAQSSGAAARRCRLEGFDAQL